jgi:hypothetical protein
VDVLGNLYQNLIKLSIKENKKLGKQMQQPLHNYDKLYREIIIPFKENRQLHIRWIKFPTFIYKDKPQYYAVFLNNIAWWRKGEIKQIIKQTRESIDNYDVDSHTIFQLGILHGNFDPMENINIRYYKTFIFNTSVFTVKHQEIVYKFIRNFLQKRINGCKKEGIDFGITKKDVARLSDFVNFLDSIFSYNIIRNNYKNSFNNSSYNKRKGGN